MGTSPVGCRLHKYSRKLNMEYDPADIPILIGAFAFGPAAGLALTAVTALIQGVTVSAGSGIYGIIMPVLDRVKLQEIMIQRGKE